MTKVEIYENIIELLEYSYVIDEKGMPKLGADLDKRDSYISELQRLINNEFKKDNNMLAVASLLVTKDDLEREFDSLKYSLHKWIKEGKE